MVQCHVDLISISTYIHMSGHLSLFAIIDIVCLEINDNVLVCIDSYFAFLLVKVQQKKKITEYYSILV